MLESIIVEVCPSKNSFTVVNKRNALLPAAQRGRQRWRFTFIQGS